MDVQWSSRNTSLVMNSRHLHAAVSEGFLRCLHCFVWKLACWAGLEEVALATQAQVAEVEAAGL